MVIGNQVNEFTSHLVSRTLHSLITHFYPGFKSKVSILTHFSLELACEDFYFLDQAVVDFENGLDSILTGSVNLLEQNASFDETNAMLYSVSSGYLHYC